MVVARPPTGHHLIGMKRVITGCAGSARRSLARRTSWSRSGPVVAGPSALRWRPGGTRVYSAKVTTRAGSLEERGRELDALSRLIGSAAGGAGVAALIEGEAGIGKTALVAAAR